jgi:hypothetical protein
MSAQSVTQSGTHRVELAELRNGTAPLLLQRRLQRCLACLTGTQLKLAEVMLAHEPQENPHIRKSSSA